MTLSHRLRSRSKRTIEVNNTHRWLQWCPHFHEGIPIIPVKIGTGRGVSPFSGGPGAKILWHRYLDFARCTIYIRSYATLSLRDVWEDIKFSLVACIGTKFAALVESHAASKHNTQHARWYTLQMSAYAYIQSCTHAHSYISFQPSISCMLTSTADTSEGSDPFVAIKLTGMCDSEILVSACNIQFWCNSVCSWITIIAYFQWSSTDWDREYPHDVGW